MLILNTLLKFWLQFIGRLVGKHIDRCGVLGLKTPPLKSKNNSLAAEFFMPFTEVLASVHRAIGW